MLRGLRVVERFPARGLNALNVDEATRLALRERMAADNLARLLTLSGRVTSCTSRMILIPLAESSGFIISSAATQNSAPRNWRSSIAAGAVVGRARRTEMHCRPR